MLKSLFGRREVQVAPASAEPTKAPKKDARRAIFRAYLGAVELADIARSEQRSGARMLDIGGAYGIHARFFRRNAPGLTVEVLDTVPTAEPLVFTGSYMDYTPTEPYDYIWASHVLEHLRNPGLFFDKLFADLKPGGWAAITVPPLKHDMTFAHVTLWNAGLLLIHFIRARFDCSEARIATYGYNVTVIVQKTPRKGKPKEDCLPAGVIRKGPYFEGQIERLNWMNIEPPVLPIDEVAAIEETETRLASSSAPSGFYQIQAKKAALAYWDAESGAAFGVG